jgi:hypothetical protein
MVKTDQESANVKKSAPEERKLLADLPRKNLIDAPAGAE